MSLALVVVFSSFPFTPCPTCPSSPFLCSLSTLTLSFSPSSWCVLTQFWTFTFALPLLHHPCMLCPPFTNTSKCKHSFLSLPMSDIPPLYQVWFCDPSRILLFLRSFTILCALYVLAPAAHLCLLLQLRSKLAIQTDSDPSSLGPIGDTTVMYPPEAMDVSSWVLVWQVFDGLLMMHYAVTTALFLKTVKLAYLELFPFCDSDE